MSIKTMIVIVIALFATSVLLPIAGTIYSVSASESYSLRIAQHECKFVDLLASVPVKNPGPSGKPAELETWHLHLDLVEWKQADHC